jgi:hypothetical protein
MILIRKYLEAQLVRAFLVFILTKIGLQMYSISLFLEQFVQNRGSLRIQITKNVKKNSFYSQEMMDLGKLLFIMRIWMPDSTVGSIMKLNMATQIIWGTFQIFLMSATLECESSEYKTALVN